MLSHVYRVNFVNYSFLRYAILEIILLSYLVYFTVLRFVYYQARRIQTKSPNSQWYNYA